MKIQDRITGKIYDVYGVLNNDYGSGFLFVVWDDYKEEFLTKSNMDFIPANVNPDVLKQSQTMKNPIPNISMSANRTNIKCANEKKRTATYVSCARCEVPIPPENCTQYCPRYTPIV